MSNAAFVYGKSREWIRRNYPHTKTESGGTVPPEPVSKGSGDDLWDMAEWVDEHDRIIGVLGPRDGWNANNTNASNLVAHGCEVARFPNYAGRCTVVIPHAVTLDQILSQVSSLVGTVDLYGSLEALQVTATEKAIFPDRYVLGKDGQTPILIDGEWHDGRSGKTNLIKGAAHVGELRSTPDPTNRAVVDSLERNFRVSAGLIPQMGGETYNAMRTGRANDSMLAAAVDPRIQEAHDVMAPSLAQVHAIALEMWKNDPKLGGKKYELFSGLPGDGGLVEFEPVKHIEHTRNTVTYPIPGSDVQSTTINLGQMVGAGMMSKRSARRRHPWVSNPEAEEQYIVEETLEEAALASLVAKAQSGEVGLEQLAMIEKYARKEPDIFAAIRKADDEIRKQQATPPESPDGAPLPEMQPGLDGAPLPAGQMPVDPSGQPMQMPQSGPSPGAPMGPTPDQVGLRQMISALSQSAPPGGEAPALAAP